MALPTAAVTGRKVAQHPPYLRRARNSLANLCIADTGNECIREVFGVATAMLYA